MAFFRELTLSSNNPYFEEFAHPCIWELDNYSFPTYAAEVVAEALLVVLRHRKNNPGISSLAQYLVHVFREQHQHLDSPARSEKVSGEILGVAEAGPSRPFRKAE